MGTIDINGLQINIVSPSERQDYISDSDREMDSRAKEAVSAAIHKAKVCGKPIARYDIETQKAYLEYPDGTRSYVG